MLRPLPRGADFQIAYVSANEPVKPHEMLRVKATALKIRQAVATRREIIDSTAGITSEFALGAANWHEARGHSETPYNVLLSNIDGTLPMLRFFCQTFSGNSLVTMTPAQGLNMPTKAPHNVEKDWPDTIRDAKLLHWSHLIDRTPGRVTLKAPNRMGETGWWSNDAIVNVDTVDYQERITLMAIAGLLDRFAHRRPRILEIGGGYGAIANALIEHMQPSQYVICDLPESLLISGAYLSALHEGVDMATGDGLPGSVCLLPNYLAQIALPGEHFDLVINTLSLSEMSPHQVSTYGQLVSACIGASGAFFEQNFDNSHVGLTNCRDHIKGHFKYSACVDFGDIPVTRGVPRLWWN